MTHLSGLFFPRSRDIFRKPAYHGAFNARGRSVGRMPCADGRLRDGSLVRLRHTSGCGVHFRTAFYTDRRRFSPLYGLYAGSAGKYNKTYRKKSIKNSTDKRSEKNVTF